jgi:hypothetical protein
VHLPIRPIRNRWPALLERRAERFFWVDPTVVLNPDADPDVFRRAMNAVHVGGTIKITGTNRHPRSDALLADNVDLTGKHVVDIGASDGSTSVDLIRRLPDFGRYTIADLYLHVGHRQVGRHHVFYDPAGEPILVAGRRAVAWPSLSRAVARRYAGLLRRAERSGPAERVLLLNPTAQGIVRNDPRVTYREHDVFTHWQGERPDAVKIANLLRRLYFSDAQIRQALQMVIDDLPDGGHLLIVDNPRIAGIPERGGLYRRDDGRFVLVAQTDHAPEIADLVLDTRTGKG